MLLFYLLLYRSSSTGKKIHEFQILKSNRRKDDKSNKLYFVLSTELQTLIEAG